MRVTSQLETLDVIVDVRRTGTRHFTCWIDASTLERCLEGGDDRCDEADDR